MSRLYDALRAAQSDLTKKFEQADAPAPRPTDAAPSGAKSGEPDQYLALAERLGGLGRDAEARVVALAGVRGGEGATTVAHQFAHFLGTRFGAPAVVVSAGPPGAGGDGSAARLDGLLEPATERADRHYATARLAIGQPGPAAEELRAVLDSAKAAYRWVLLDCAAILSPEAPTRLFAIADAVVVVAESERTAAKDLEYAARIVSAAGGELTGMILNKRPRKVPGRLRAFLEKLRLS